MYDLTPIPKSNLNSRGYRDNIDQKSEVFLDPLTLFLTLGGVDHRTVAQESRAAPAARREAPAASGSVGKRSGSVRELRK